MFIGLIQYSFFNTLRPRQNGRYFPDDVFKCIFLNENIWISIKISLKFVPKGPINNILALVQIMACRRPGDKPLSELMLVSLLMHICVTRPQWDNNILEGCFTGTRTTWIYWPWRKCFLPDDAYMCQWIQTSLIQIMTFCLTGAKLLPEPTTLT